MLQQTQVSRVLQKYPLFLKAFPRIRSLAEARTSTVIRTWRGMGYNSRAIRLQRLAQTVVREQNGRLPCDTKELMKLPGVGRYTAYAIACFAFHQDVPVVDTNIHRILSRLFPKKIKSSSSRQRQLEESWHLAEWLLPKRRAFAWNQALMDLGATICTAANPKCEVCPVRSSCPSAFNDVSQKPRTAKREPGYDGIPNRIYRGRIVEVLRNLNGRRTISPKDLGRMIKKSYGKRDERWLHALLVGLRSDGLLELNREKSILRVSLPQ